MIAVVVRTSVTLPEDTSDLLKREAKRLGKPSAQIVREALDAHLGICREPKRKLPFESLVEGTGENLSGRVDEILRQGWADAIARDS